MALVTVSRSPPASGHSTPVGPTQDQASKRRSRLQRRQSFAVLRGAVLGLQDEEDNGEAADAGPEAVEGPLGEEQPHSDQTDDGQGPQSPQKQQQSQHLHLMVELLRPQDDIRLNQGLNRTSRVSRVCWPMGLVPLAASAGPHTLCYRVSHILNVAREIDNFYPDRFIYHNVRLWDEESAQLLPHWKETHGFVEAARAQGTRVLVHCKMGVSRSAATVIAYAMKQYGWSLEQALRHVQELRPIARPNPGFLRQLQTYQGILTASRQSHIWEQKVGGASPEEPLAPEMSTPFPPLPPEPGGSGEAKAMGLEESRSSALKEEPGPRPRINLRGVMRSISLLEPSSELESISGASDLPEVFSSNESSEEDPPVPFPQLSKAKGGEPGSKGPWPALKSHQSVVALNSAALVASRTRALQEQAEAGRSSTPRLRKVVRQASVDGSGEEGEA
ncbi:protein phosphatase Slingshot homolog 3 [Puma concolor]|uniref:protein-serine/threonine phosphatase n=1 Tax=Puma concolor TaxID=9696 RepID=A0A6P6H6N6_PUMCO|nr:protein phosphatase Slingshot homolog 3 [Puma concolor]